MTFSAMTRPAGSVAPEDGTRVKFLPNEMRSLFHRGFQRKTSEANLTGKRARPFLIL